MAVPFLFNKVDGSVSYNASVNEFIDFVDWCDRAIFDNWSRFRVPDAVVRVIL